MYPWDYYWYFILVDNARIFFREVCVIHQNFGGLRYAFLYDARPIKTIALSTKILVDYATLLVDNARPPVKNGVEGYLQRCCMAI